MKPLLRIVHQIHGGAGVVTTHVVGFDQIGGIDGGAVTESKGPVLNGGDEWAPDAGWRLARLVDEL